MTASTVSPIAVTEGNLRIPGHITLGELVKGRDNSFDHVRLVAAWLVLVGHSYALRGEGSDPLASVIGFTDFGSFAISVFFILSGFLIARSWLNDPDPLRYLGRRLLRIMPGLGVCVLVTAFVLGPLFTRLSAVDYFSNLQTWRYLENVTMYIMRYPLPGLFENHPNSAVNGSLWSLRVEFTLYLLILILGMLRLLRLWPVCAIIAIVIVAHLFVLDRFVPRDRGIIAFFTGGRVELIVYFMSGSLLYLIRDYIRLDRRLFACMVLVLAGAVWLPHPELLWLFALPYCILYICLRSPPSWLSLKRFGDISYGMYIYAFPIQQSVFSVERGRLPIFIYVLICTVLTAGAATASWYWVERTALRRKPGTVSKAIASPEPSHAASL